MHADSIALEASAGVVASNWVAPGPAFGLALGGAMRWRAFFARAGGTHRRTGEQAAIGWRPGLVLAGLGAVLPCARIGPVFGCAVLQAGSAQTSGSGVLPARSESLPWLATGGRLGVLFQVSQDAQLRIVPTSSPTWTA